MKSYKYKVAAFYKFIELKGLTEWQKIFSSFLASENIKGTVLLANEGVNGTVAGQCESIENFRTFLDANQLLSEKNYKTSFCDEEPFPRLKVKLKKEIVSIGNSEANPNANVGIYVQPEEWNNLIADKDVLLLDTRNIYEHSIGTFRGALHPETQNFREFPAWVSELEVSEQNKDKKIAMFCTGGIRCEKASSLMMARGFKNIFHLQGGILNYFKKVDRNESAWDGECFVFDDRVALNQNLEVGSYDMCHGCRMPITEEDKIKKEYERGVSCPNCFYKKTVDQKKRYADRQKQVDLAKLKNKKHIGACAQSIKK